MRSYVNIITRQSENDLLRVLDRIEAEAKRLPLEQSEKALALVGEARSQPDTREAALARLYDFAVGVGASSMVAVFQTLLT